MSKTSYSTQGDNILINGKLTYTELENSSEKVHGLLFNARFIQGVFEDANPANTEIYNRFGKIFDKDQNTDELVDALESWYNAGLRAITVGLQGGGPICSYSNWSVIDTNTFSRDGKTINPETKKRLEKIIKKCDELGMLVIVSVLYQAQIHLLDGSSAMLNAVQSTCEYLRDLDYSNVIIEVANEHEIVTFVKHPLFGSADGMAAVINWAKIWCGGKFAVGCSCAGGVFESEVCEASDIILIHGNGLHREQYYRMIKRIQAEFPNKPIVCNEDSPRFSQLNVGVDTHTSWGYYNNFTKQEPPTPWEITKGEDEFFVARMQQLIYGTADTENEIYLQGFEENMTIKGGYYVRVAATYPEKLNCVKYYEDDVLLDIAYSEPFLMYSLTTWEQKPYFPSENAKIFRAEVLLASGEIKNITINL